MHQIRRMQEAIDRLYWAKQVLGERLVKQIEELQRRDRIMNFLEEHLLLVQSLQSMRKKMKDDQQELIELWVNCFCAL